LFDLCLKSVLNIFGTMESAERLTFEEIFGVPFLHRTARNHRKPNPQNIHLDDAADHHIYYGATERLGPEKPERYSRKNPRQRLVRNDREWFFQAAHGLRFPAKFRWQRQGESWALRMARRPGTDPVMSREELSEFSRRLSMLSIDGVEGVYRTAHNDCRFDGKRFPPAAAVQQLVAAWKVLRKFRSRT
jgi:hypothetical protein